jgi:predicted transcriptional regulator
LEIKDLFFEFSNEDRIAVFRSLYEKDKKHSEIEKDLDITGSEVSRHLKRLREKHLVNKTREGKYRISNIGKIFYWIINLFKVSIKHKDFFNTHDITSIPLYLILQLGELHTLELSTKTLKNIELWSDFVKNSEQFIYAITDQFQNSLLPIVEQNIHNQNLEIRALIDKSLLKSYNIPKEWSEKFKDPIKFYKKLNIYENIRVLDDIGLSFVVSEKGGILFLNKGNDIDYSQCLIDNHPSFINWCKDLFEFYWNRGKSLKPFIRKALKSYN